MPDPKPELVEITVMGYRCSRCGHEWVPMRNATRPPRVCPSCKSPYYDRPRRGATPPTASEPRTLPTTAELAGSDPDYTGELSTAEYLAQARGERAVSAEPQYIVGNQDGRRHHWTVCVSCFRLVGLLTAQWRVVAGGTPALCADCATAVETTGSVVLMTPRP